MKIMKKIYFILSLSILIMSCEDVIEVDLPEEEPRLIVNGLVRVDKSKEFVGVKIRLSQTDNFFGEIIPAQAESVNIAYGIEDEQGFIENPAFSTLAERIPGSGVYEPLISTTRENRIRTANVNPDVTFYLSINYKDRLYFSRTMYVPTVPIDNLEQGDDFLFDEDDTEIKITYTDVEDRDDFYLFDLDFDNFLVSEDKFYKGQQFSFSYFYDQNLNIGDEIEISILGADREFFNYMNLLIQQTDEDFNVFETPAATIRGNVFDLTDIDNDDQFDNVGDPNSFPLGYFAVVQEYKQSIIVQSE